MELYLQFAYGMKKIVLELSKDWEGSNCYFKPTGYFSKTVGNME